MNSKFQTLVKDFAVPVVVATIPFLPTIYAKVTEPTVHFVYESTNNRNPVTEWNRQLERWLKQLEAPSVKTLDKIPPVWLKRIGEEVQKSLPALLAGAGLKPTENTAVNVMNLSGNELKNIRIHFTGCSGYDSFTSWPDAMGSSSNPPVSGPTTQGRVTLRYDKMPTSTAESDSLIQIVFYGDNTAQCSPEVEADTFDGRPAIGRKVVLQEYRTERAQRQRTTEERVELSFKLFLVAGMLFIYFQLRQLRRQAESAA